MPVEPIIETNPRAAPVFNKELFAQRVKKIPEALQSIGFDKLRPGQQRPLYSILAEVDTLCILPTSFGKSLIYTLPSLVCGWKTMIFSPLVALMQDQVQGMWKRGIRAAQLSGMQTEAENEQAIRDWMAGDLHMLYLAPERLDNPRFIHAVQQVRPDCVAIDEAHCFPGDVVVNTEFGPRTLHDMFQTYSAGHYLPKVMTADDEGRVVYRRVKNVFQNPTQKLVRVKFKENGILDCTPNHMIFLENGEERPAGELKKGDKVIMHNTARCRVRGLNPDQFQLILGSYLGDGGLQQTAKNSDNFRVTYTHGWDQREYCSWKIHMLGGKLYDIEKNGYSGKKARSGRTNVYSLPGPVYEPEGYGRWTKKVRISQWMLDAMDVRALAVWAMDDGSVNKHATNPTFTFHTQSFLRESLERVVETMQSKFGLTAKIRETSKGLILALGVEDTDKLLGMIAPYMHEDLMCKLAGRYSSIAGTYDWSNYAAVLPVEVESVVESCRKNEEHLYDMEVEDVHRYFVSAKCAASNRSLGYNSQVYVLVHNCASQWGYNFRASYRKIGDFIEEYSPKVVAAFTATCPPRVEKDVRSIFRIEHAVKYVHTQRRDSLILSSAPFNGYPDLARRVKEVPGSCVVYCSTVKEVMETAQALQTFLPQDTITIFHGQLADSEKNANLRQFMNDHARVVVCTNAFGMGVDKAAVRGVIHRNIPGTMDAVIQETGRASRDGLPSWCTMLYDEDSIKTQEFFLDSGNPPEENVRSVYGVLYRLSMGGEREIRTPQHKIAASAGISKAHISAVMELLKGEGVITTEPARDKIAKVKPLVPTETDPRLKRLVDLALSEGRPDSQGWLEINLIRMADNMGVVESTLRNYLNRWTKDKLIEFQPPYVGNVTRLQKDLSGVDFEHLADKRKADRKNLDLVLEYCRAPDDEKHGLFERYLEYEHNQESFVYEPHPENC